MLGFPFIFRGALDVRARKINEEMKLAAVHALAELARARRGGARGGARRLSRTTCFDFGPSYIIPKPFDPRSCCTSPVAVAQAAMESGVARRKLDLADYRAQARGDGREPAREHGRARDTSPRYRLDNPLAPRAPAARTAPRHDRTLYAEAIELGRELLERPKRGGGPDRVRVQHAKQPHDGVRAASACSPTASRTCSTRTGARTSTARRSSPASSTSAAATSRVYGHDFTLRAGSMDATNGAQAREPDLPGRRARHPADRHERHAPARSCRPASAASTATARRSRRCARSAASCRASCACSATTPAAARTCRARARFMIQAGDTFFGLTGPGVVKSVLGEDVTRRRPRRPERARR